MIKVKLNEMLLLTLSCCCAITLVAADSTGYGATFISNPAIYAYSVTSQQPTHNTNRNYIEFESANGDNIVSTNRNYYNINNDNNSNDNASKSSSSSSTVGVVGAQSTLTTPPATQPAPLTGCTLDRLAVYKVVLHTYWTRDLFPKHYPDWRPTAQWTKTLGRTHNANYALYHMGQQATPGVKQFAETGKTEQLDSNAGEQQQMLAQSLSRQVIKIGAAAAAAATTAGPVATTATATATATGERSVFDEFNLPAIGLGAGRSEAKLFVDSNHSLVSLMTRIVPSPDWFIGVDSFELCVGGSWIDTVTVEVDPLDAGTDNGFTFTAPNWPTSPQGVIYRITSRYPAHPAGSFYYPKSKRLPPMATFQFIKLKEYELSEVFNFAEDDRKYETVKTQTHLETEHNHVEMNNELSASIERERQTEFGMQPAQQSETDRQRIRSQLLAKMNTNNNNINVVPKNDKHAIMQSIANSYRRTEAKGNTNMSAALPASSPEATPLGQTPLGGRSRSSTAARRRRDCRVSHWSEWTACSKTCGIGEMHRYRKVIKHGKRGGRPCPPLQESKWCGTERGCRAPDNYFNWSDT